ncbi:hypothetical protein C8J57DRAFT_1255060 [Mycena rebaudengoi]|nr:hypothetical protein C8J57DRAFT_1255060 [Mycena rebaudengoi]
MNSAPFADGGVQEVIQISSLTEPSLEVIQVNPCGIGKQLRVLGPKFCGERLWNISLHRMEGQGRAASHNCSRTLLGRHVKSAASYTIVRRCGGENMGRKKSAGYRINSNTIQCQATIAEYYFLPTAEFNALQTNVDGNLSELENLVEHRIHTAYGSPNSVPPPCWFLKSIDPY